MITNYLLPFLTLLFCFQIYANHCPSDKSKTISHVLVIKKKNLKNNINLSEVSAIIETAASAIILEYNTTLGTDNTVTLPLHGTVNVTIDWVYDNAIQIVTTARNVDHTYQLAGTYTVGILASLQQFGPWNYTNANKLTKVFSFGGSGLTSLDAAFMIASSIIEMVVKIPATVNSLNQMFSNTASFNFDTGSWDLRNVTNIIAIFIGAYFFNQNISSWDVSNVTNMFVIFAGATSFNQNISRWNVSNVTNMRSMFFRASSFNQDISTSSISTKQRVFFCYYSARKSL